MLSFHLRNLVSKVIEEELVLFLLVECNFAGLLHFLHILLNLADLCLKVVAELIFVSQCCFELRLLLIEMFDLL